MSTFAEHGQVEAASLYVMQWEEAASGVADLQAAQVEVVYPFVAFPDLVLVRLTAEQATVWRQHPQVRSVEADGRVSIRLWGEQDPADGNVPDPYGTVPGLQLIRADVVQEKGYFGAGVRIAILDTGVNANSKRVQVAEGVSFVEDEPEWDDMQGHGTAMAAVIGMQTAPGEADRSGGVAPHAELYAVKVLNRFGHGPISAVLRGLEWAILQKMDIVTMCFGTPVHSAALEAALDVAYAHGLLLVAPTGNVGATDGVDVPARYRAVIAVGAVDARGVLAPFSNQGPEVELVAPGVSIAGLFLQDLPLWQSGTSLAAAHVAGAAALLKAGVPELGNHALRERLAKSAAARGEREQYGFGVVNAAAALQVQLEVAAASEVAEGDAAVAAGDPPFAAENASLLQKETTDLPPSQRAEASKRWYQQASPYDFSIWDPFTLHMQDLYFGMDVEIFSMWEIESNRLSDERFARGEVNYWEFVNARFMRDIAEAERLVANGETASHYRVQRLVDYRKQGLSWIAEHGQLKLTHVLKLLEGDEAEHFYRHLLAMTVSFWLSHNTAIIYWDKRARASGIRRQEELYESHFIDGVIIRLDYSADMPYSVPPFGHYTPPIGVIGFLLHHGPFRYPEQYPAPEPPPAPEGMLDYEDETTFQLVKTYLEYMMKNGTSSVFTWWLPTPSDRELSEFHQQPNVALLATPSDWKREVLEPTWKTVEALEAKYLQDDSSRTDVATQTLITDRR